MYAHRLITVLYTGIKQKNVSEICPSKGTTFSFISKLSKETIFFCFFKYSMVEIFQSETIRENKKKDEMFTV